MHAAPPVRMEPAPDAAWHCFAIACAGWAAANLAAWIAMLMQQSTAMSATAALLAGAAAAAIAGWALRRHAAPVCALDWDGSAWSCVPLRGEIMPGELRVMIDLGAWMLLRFVPGGSLRSAAWLPVSRRKAGAQWPLWRAALFSRRPAAAAAPVDPA